MSYILEALKKAEQQRDLGQVPGIDSEHDKRSGPVSRRWLWFMLLAVNAVILLLLILLWQRTNFVAIVEPDSVAIAEPATVVPETETPRVRKPQPAPWPVTSEREIMPARPINRMPVATVNDAQSRSPQRKAPLNVIPVEPEAVQDIELPVWPQVPDYMLARLTNGLRLDVHVYSDRPEDRFILINLAKYREGETLQEGPIVQEITARGAILSLQGERFLLPAQ